MAKNWADYEDARRPQRIADEARAAEREREATAASWEAAAKHFHPVPSLYQIDWDACSPEAKRAKLQADDAAAVAAQATEQQGQLDALMARPGVRLQRWREYLATSAGQRAATQHDAEDEIPSWFK